MILVASVAHVILQYCQTFGFPCLVWSRSKQGKTRMPAVSPPPEGSTTHFPLFFLKFASRCGFGVMHCLFHLNQSFKFTVFSKAFCSSFQMYCFFPWKVRVFFVRSEKKFIFLKFMQEIYIYTYLSVCLSFYLSIYLSIYLSMSMCLYIERSILSFPCETTTTCVQITRNVNMPHPAPTLQFRSITTCVQMTRNVNMPHPTPTLQ